MFLALTENRHRGRMEMTECQMAVSSFGLTRKYCMTTKQISMASRKPYSIMVNYSE